MLDETMVAALRKGNEGCFTCGNKNHLKRDCPKKAKKKKKKEKIKIKNLQKSALPAVEEYIGPKIVSLNLTLKENLFQETPTGDPPQVPFTKNQGQIPSFPSKPQHPAVLLAIYQLCF